MTIVNLSLSEIHDLALEAFTQNGCDPQNAGALTRTVVAAERDGSHSHGLFRVPGYVASLRSGKVNGAADPQISNKSPVIVNANGDDGYAPLAIERGIPALAKAASEFGIAVMTLTHTHHFAALWPEVEALAEQNLAGMACVSYMPNVAPHGSNKPLFGTNPLAFAWPRKNKPPFVFDMATSAMAGGDIAIAARDGHSVPLGTGLDENGNETTDPAAILKGVMLPFGGHKGSAISTMVELLAAGATGNGLALKRKMPTTVMVALPVGESFSWHFRHHYWPVKVGRTIAKSFLTNTRQFRDRVCRAQGATTTAMIQPTVP